MSGTPRACTVKKLARKPLTQTKSARKKGRDDTNYSPNTTTLVCTKKQELPHQKSVRINGREYKKGFQCLSFAPANHSPTMTSGPNMQKCLWDKGDGVQLVYKCNYDGYEEDYKSEAVAFAVSQLHFKPDGVALLLFLFEKVTEHFNKGKWDKKQVATIKSLLRGIALLAQQTALDIASRRPSPPTDSAHIVTDAPSAKITTNS